MQVKDNDKIDINKLNNKPFPLVANVMLEELTDPKTNEQLAELIATFGPESDIVKPLAALKAVKDDEARSELIRLLQESGEKQMPLMALDLDHVCLLAAKFHITNREISDWRKRHILKMAKEGLITDADIERETFIEELALEQLTAKLVKNGELVREGAGYRTPAAV